MCLGAIYWAQLDAIYYGNTKADAAAIGFNDHFIYDEISQPVDQRKLQMIQVLNSEALQAFKLWEASVSKTGY